MASIKRWTSKALPYVFGLLSQIIICLLLSTASQADNANPTEEELKATYLYNFAYFVTWPQIPSTFLFCSYSNSPVTHILSSLINGEKVHDRPMQLLIDPSPKQLHDCHVIYIPAQQERILAATLEYIKPYPILTVSDIGDFEQRGGMIKLSLENQRIQPVIRLNTANQVGLQISTKLLLCSQVLE